MARGPGIAPRSGRAAGQPPDSRGPLARLRRALPRLLRQLRPACQARRAGPVGPVLPATGRAPALGPRDDRVRALPGRAHPGRFLLGGGRSRPAPRDAPRLGGDLRQPRGRGRRDRAAVPRARVAGAARGRARSRRRADRSPGPRGGEDPRGGDGVPRGPRHPAATLPRPARHRLDGRHLGHRVRGRVALLSCLRPRPALDRGRRAGRHLVLRHRRAVGPRRAGHPPVGDAAHHGPVRRHRGAVSASLVLTFVVLLWVVPIGLHGLWRQGSSTSRLRADVEAMQGGAP